MNDGLGLADRVEYSVVVTAIEVLHHDAGAKFDHRCRHCLDSATLGVS